MNHSHKYKVQNYRTPKDSIRETINNIEYGNDVL